MLTLHFKFTPADGSAPRDIKATIATQEDKERPIVIMIDLGDAHPERLRMRGSPLFSLMLAARSFARRILDRVELWGEGTLDPEVERPVPFPVAESGK